MHASTRHSTALRTDEGISSVGALSPSYDITRCKLPLLGARERTQFCPRWWIGAIIIVHKLHPLLSGNSHQGEDQDQQRRPMAQVAHDAGLM